MKLSQKDIARIIKQAGESVPLTGTKEQRLRQLRNLRDNDMNKFNSGCYDGKVGFGEGIANEENWDV